MSAVKLVVGNAASLTSGDTKLKTLLEGMGHTVTLTSDETAESVSGIDLVVVADSVSTATLGEKYHAQAVPLMVMQPSWWDEANLITDGASVSTSTLTSEYILTATHDVTDGPHGTFSVGTITIASTGNKRYLVSSSNLAAGATAIMAFQSASQTAYSCFAIEQGGTLANSAGAAPHRRFGWGNKDDMYASWDADGENLFKNAVAWALGSAAAADLVIADMAHGHAMDGTVLTQQHELAVADLAHSNAMDAIALTQQHQLTVADLLHANNLDDVSLAGEHTLAIADATHGQAMDPVSLTQQHQLTVADLLHLQSADSIALTQAHQLAVGDMLHGHSADNVNLVEVTPSPDVIGPVTATLTARGRTTATATAGSGRTTAEVNHG